MIASLLLAASCAYVTSFAGEGVCGFRVPDGKSLGCAQTGKKPHGVALSPDGARIYVSNEGSNWVAVVDAATMKKLSEVPVGREPNQIALSPKGDRLWVTNHADATVSLISTATPALEKTIAVGREPHVMTTSAARNAAIITSEGDDALDLFDLTTLERVGHVPVFGFPRVLAVTPDDATAFLTVRWLNGALLVDLAGRGPYERIALGEPKFAAQGKDAHGIALTPDAKTVLIMTQMTHQLTLVDRGSLKVLGRVHVGKNPNWIGLTPDGKYAVVSTTDDDSASIVDLAARKVVAVAHVGHQPKRLIVGNCPGGA
jgi:YVTN family beta-propeller protein